MREINLQHNKQHTLDAREADEHIILNELYKEIKACYLCGKEYQKALFFFGIIIEKQWGQGINEFPRKKKQKTRKKDMNTESQ